MLDTIRNLFFSTVQLSGLFLTVPKNLVIVFWKAMIAKFKNLGSCLCSESDCFGLHHKPEELKDWCLCKGQKTEKGI